MLKKRMRLTTPEVTAVLKKSSTIRGQFLYMKHSPSIESLKIAAVVPKSVAKKAVKRNKLRRVVYGALTEEPCATLMKSRGGNAIIFIQKIPRTNLSVEYKKDIEGILLKIR